jgi:hypothetical protein
MLRTLILSDISLRYRPIDLYNVLLRKQVSLILISSKALRPDSVIPTTVKRELSNPSVRRNSPLLVNVEILVETVPRLVCKSEAMLEMRNSQSLISKISRIRYCVRVVSHSCLKKDRNRFSK